MTAVKSNRLQEQSQITIRGVGDSAETMLSIKGAVAFLSHEQLLDLNETIQDRLKFLRSLSKVKG